MGAEVEATGECDNGGDEETVASWPAIGTAACWRQATGSLAALRPGQDRGETGRWPSARPCYATAEVLGEARCGIGGAASCAGRCSSLQGNKSSVGSQGWGSCGARFGGAQFGALPAKDRPGQEQGQGATRLWSACRAAEDQCSVFDEQWQSSLVILSAKTTVETS